MIRNRAIVRGVARRIASAVRRTVSALEEGRIEQEPAFTDRMLGAIEETMHGFESNGVIWQAKTFTDRGRNAQETQIGADFAGILSIDLPGFKVKKGFLAQAKLLKMDYSFPPYEFERLKQQSELMLCYSPESFVFFYSVRGVFVVPAISIVNSEPRNPFEFYSKSITRFYEEHLESFIGDQRLTAPNIGSIDGLRERLGVQNLLFLEARDSWNIERS